MPDKQSDVLMKFVFNGQSVPAGGTSVLKKDDRLLFDFWAGKFFEITDFGIGLNLTDFESEKPATPPSQPPTQPGAAPTAIAAPQKAKFASWRDKKKTSLEVAKLPPFPVEIDPFSVTRLVDCASPMLFESCAATRTFDSATIVKRRATGQTLALQTFLRVDFTSVLLVGVNWTGGELLEEKLRFICRGLKVQYRAQGSDGSLGAAAPSEWDQTMALRTA